jgi:hypothetical protein
VGKLMITIATLLWDANERSESFSRCYDETWVDKLYRQCARNLTGPFRFVCFTDRRRTFTRGVEQALMTGRDRRIGYGDCIEPFRLGVPMILMGLDTVILRNIDHLARWCLDMTEYEGRVIALPRDPYNIRQACNGVVLSPGNRSDIWNTWSGHNDMEWLRQFPHLYIDDVFPGSVVSYKGYILGQTGQVERGVPDPHSFNGVDICYMHGVPKQHELLDVPEIKEAWV